LFGEQSRGEVLVDDGLDAMRLGSDKIDVSGELRASLTVKNTASGAEPKSCSSTPGTQPRA
jgi:hypothetical protein